MSSPSEATIAVWCYTAHDLMKGETPEGYLQALPWLRRAARTGEPWAAYHLGLMFDHGLGVRRNVAKAIKWYSQAAEGGYDSAQLNLGIVYANLPGARRDLGRALVLYRSAARQGNRNAMYNLGLYYDRSRGVRRSVRLAKHWYGKAAELGDRQARSRLKALAATGAELAVAPEPAHQSDRASASGLARAR
jgi:TPR repeat protein